MKRSTILRITGIMLAVATGGLLAWAYLTFGHQAATLKDQVSKHMVLPNDESPAELTILDKHKVTTDFLKQAENGDRVLVYQKNKKIIIYRPSVDRIVDIGPVQIDDVSSLK